MAPFRCRESPCLLLNLQIWLAMMFHVFPGVTSSNAPCGPVDVTGAPQRPPWIAPWSCWSFCGGHCKYVAWRPSLLVRRSYTSSLWTPLASLGSKYLLRYGDWGHCYVGARRVQSYLLRFGTKTDPKRVSFLRFASSALFTPRQSPFVVIGIGPIETSARSLIGGFLSDPPGGLGRNPNPPRMQLLDPPRYRIDCFSFIRFMSYVCFRVETA